MGCDGLWFVFCVVGKIIDVPVLSAEVRFVVWAQISGDQFQVSFS